MESLKTTTRSPFKRPVSTMPADTKKERLKQERREAIIRAALRVFVERGVQSATMDGIAREAEVSKGALYLYFESKDELFLTIALDWLHELNARAEEIDQSAFPDGLSAYRHSMQTYIDHGVTHRDRFLVAMSWLTSSYSVDEKSSTYEDYKTAIARLQGHCCLAIDRAKADGSLQLEIPTARFAMQMWGAALGQILVEQNADEIARRTSVSLCLEGTGREFFDLIFSNLGATSRGYSETPQPALAKGTDA